MKLDIYQVDAFTSKPFGGNPAAVVPLETWLPDETMQSIALENNLSETAFFLKRDGLYEIRWFTPTFEIDLCGHATLASAFVIFDVLGLDTTTIKFHSRKSGELSVGQIVDRVGISQSALSQHLAKLREEGLVATRKEAQTVFYRVCDPKAGQVLTLLHDLFCPELGRETRAS